jgi:hypothetical protein
LRVTAHSEVSTWASTLLLFGDCPETIPRHVMLFELSQLSGRLARDSISYVSGQDLNGIRRIE